jgi:hypothetical protein
MTAPLALALLLSAAPPEAPAPDYHLMALPWMAYGSDLGVTASAATFLYRPSAIAGRMEQITASGSWSSAGPRGMLVQWSVPEWEGTGLASALDLRLSDDDRNPYWGEGGQLGGLSVSPGAGATPPAYRYHARQAFLTALLRPSRAELPAPYARVRLGLMEMVDPGALLAAARPPGWQGGNGLLAEVGLLLDRRDRETGTHRGVLASASLAGAGALAPLATSLFLDVDLAVAAFVPLARWATLAAHAFYDAKIGDVPFYERTSYEGLSYGGGLGGAGTLRGIARSRLAGEQKGLASLELRADAWEGRPFGERRLVLGAAGGVDAGYAHQRGYPALYALGGFLGLRLLWDEAVLIRLEMGYAGQDGTAVYIVTGEQF